jgi:hypothetical protein
VFKKGEKVKQYQFLKIKGHKLKPNQGLEWIYEIAWVKFNERIVENVNNSIVVQKWKQYEQQQRISRVQPYHQGGDHQVRRFFHYSKILYCVLKLTLLKQNTFLPANAMTIECKQCDTFSMWITRARVKFWSAWGAPVFFSTSNFLKFKKISLKTYRNYEIVSINLC